MTAQPRLTTRPDPADALTVWACWVGAPDHYTLDWGDGTPPQRLPSWSDPVKHTYPAPGRYLIVARAEHDPAQTSTGWVSVHAPVPASLVGLDLTVRVIVSPQAQAGATLKIAWPDWDSETLHLGPGEHVEAPAMPGSRQVTLTDTATGQTHTSRVTVTDPQDIYGGLDVSTDGRTVSVRRTLPESAGSDSRSWFVHWGDEWDADPWAKPTPLPGRGWISHTYERSGAYFVEVASSGQGMVYTRARQVVIR